jgi:hypothetical protein
MPRTRNAPINNIATQAEPALAFIVSYLHFTEFHRTLFFVECLAFIDTWPTCATGRVKKMTEAMISAVSFASCKINCRPCFYRAIAAAPHVKRHTLKAIFWSHRIKKMTYVLCFAN